MDPDHDNVHNNNTITENNKNTGICKVTISGGTIGVDNPTDPTKQGNVFENAAILFVLRDIKTNHQGMTLVLQL